MKEIKGSMWVRLPKEVGYAEGITRWMDSSQRNWAVHVPGPAHPNLDDGMEDDGYLIYCPPEWLTPIDEPSIREDAPSKNIDSSGHPVMEIDEVDMSLIISFIRSVERGETDKICWCPWTPLKLGEKEGRLRSGEHPQCPAHTKEGFLIGFLNHLWQRVRSVREELPEHATNYTKQLADLSGNVFEEEIIETTDGHKAAVRWLE